jgi:hypothetical protein
MGSSLAILHFTPMSAGLVCVFKRRSEKHMGYPFHYPLPYTYLTSTLYPPTIHSHESIGSDSIDFPAAGFVVYLKGATDGRIHYQETKRASKIGGRSCFAHFFKENWSKIVLSTFLLNLRPSW